MRLAQGERKEMRSDEGEEQGLKHPIVGGQDVDFLYPISSGRPDPSNTPPFSDMYSPCVHPVSTPSSGVLAPDPLRSGVSPSSRDGCIPTIVITSHGGGRTADGREKPSWNGHPDGAESTLSNRGMCQTVGSRLDRQSSVSIQSWPPVSSLQSPVFSLRSLSTLGSPIL